MVAAFTIRWLLLLDVCWPRSTQRWNMKHFKQFRLAYHKLPDVMGLSGLAGSAHHAAGVMSGTRFLSACT